MMQKVGGIGFRFEEGKLCGYYADGSPLKTFTELKEEKETAIEEKDSALKEVEKLKARLRELGESPD